MHKNFIKITAVFVQFAYEYSLVKMHKKVPLTYKKLDKLHKGTVLADYTKPVNFCKIEVNLK